MSKARELAREPNRATTPNNRVINGSFHIWQRGSSFTSPTSDITADRWQYSKKSGSASDCVVAPVLSAAVMPGVYLHVNVTTADTSVAVDDFAILRHHIEGYNISDFEWGTGAAKTVTLSFYHAHTKTGTYSVSLRNATQDRSYVAEYTQSVADAWERAEITIPGCTDGTWEFDTGIGIKLTWSLYLGTNYTTSSIDQWTNSASIGSTNQVNMMDDVANNFRITGVMLDIGSEAKDFVVPHYAEELARCQRYYEKSYDLGTAPGTLTYAGTSGFRTSVAATSMTGITADFAVPKRASPTITWYSPATGTAGYVRDVSGAVDVAVSSTSRTNSNRAGWPSLSSPVADQKAVEGHWTAEAEIY